MGSALLVPAATITGNDNPSAPASRMNCSIRQASAFSVMPGLISDITRSNAFSAT